MKVQRILKIRQLYKMNSLLSGYEFVYVDVIIVRGFPAAAFVRMRKRNWSSFLCTRRGGRRFVDLFLVAQFDVLLYM